MSEERRPITFTGSSLDRAAQLRSNHELLTQMQTDRAARFLPLWHGKALINLHGSPDLAWLERAEGDSIFLGLSADARPHFAVDVSQLAPRDATPPLAAAGKFIDLRSIAAELPQDETAIAAGARALLEWHRTHLFCACCGQATNMVEGGWRRDCPSCGAPHFPRTDPVVIMLVTHNKRLLLAGKHGFPEGLVSLIAGFVEPGESIEEAALRETREEVGLEGYSVRYLASQPWPFYSQLMIGVAVEATGAEITLEEAELRSARWFSRDEVQKMLAGDLEGYMTPRTDAIARVLTEMWLAGGR